MRGERRLDQKSSVRIGIAAPDADVPAQRRRLRVFEGANDQKRALLLMLIGLVVGLVVGGLLTLPLGGVGAVFGAGLGCIAAISVAEFTDVAR